MQRVKYDLNLGMENGPEVINVTSNANTMLTADTMTLRSASSLAALNNGGGGTLPRSSLVRNYAHGHGTLKKSADELRPLTADGHYHGHSHKPSMDTLRRVHFEKAAPPTVNGATPASPPKIMVFFNFLFNAIDVIFFKECIFLLLYCWQKCIDLNGENIEK